MGKMNLLKANYEGKVGQTVGAKWKNVSTLRTYTKPSNPNTDAQQTVRSGFKAINEFVALFADQIRYKSALDTSGMSVRNAIVKLAQQAVKLQSPGLHRRLQTSQTTQNLSPFSCRKRQAWLKSSKQKQLRLLQKAL